MGRRRSEVSMIECSNYNLEEDNLFYMDIEQAKKLMRLREVSPIEIRILKELNAQV
ncbi:hypothetical protein KQI41_06725 [Tissierella pigra]|uniref:hypothetical protein n=1 Tax=Tissierella pigra TaxID=2607614 RepID=UPI0012B1F488|nr:hypothetical protein [Tissierella pigra]MBU5426106.1 hypothetical protein [Tissierella pigra]